MKGWRTDASLSIVFRESWKTRMSQRIKSGKAKRARGFTYLWIFGLAISIFLLIYFEQTSLLYVFATLGVTVLLVIVATADLGQTELTSEVDIPSPPSAKTRK